MSRCVCFNQIDLQAQKGFLHAQLDNSLTMTSKLEAEITGLRSELRDRDAENADLRSRLTRAEVSPELEGSSVTLTGFCVIEGVKSRVKINWILMFSYFLPLCGVLQHL